MFTKKSKTENPQLKSNTLNSWLNGKTASFLIGSAVSYALYHFGIVGKIKSYFTKKPTTPIFSDNSDTQTQG